MTAEQITDEAAVSPSLPSDAAPPAVDVQRTPALDWRGFVKEIVIVVIGVLLALGAQQVVESLNWRSKVDAAEEVIRAELSNDLGLATEQKMFHGCVVSYLDTLQSAAINNDVAAIRKLANMGAPLIGRAWPRDTWTAALNGQIPDHLAADRVTTYSRAFLRIGVQREFMQQMEDLYPLALSGQFGLPRDAGVTDQQLVAIQRLKRLEKARLMISESLLNVDGPAVSVRPSEEYLASDRQFVEACNVALTRIRAIPLR